jgi:hypothetical protein
MVENFFYNGKNIEGLIRLIDSKDASKLWRFRVDEYSEKSREQEKKYHAMLNDIADQAKHLNRVFDADSWKRLTVAQFRKDCIENNIPRLADYWKKNQFEIVPGLDGSALVTLGSQTREFPMYVAAGFIEWLLAYGANCNPPILWSEPQAQWDERYAS